MQVLVFIIFFIVISVLFLFAVRVFKTSHDIFGKRTKWISLLMVISIVLALLLNRTEHIIMDLMNQGGNAVIPIISSIPIIKVIVPFIKAVPNIIRYLLWTIIVAIPIVGIVIEYYRGHYGSESYPPYDQAR